MSIEMDVTAKRNTKVTNSNKSALQYDLFDNIIGYDDIKKLFFLSFESQRPIHILLVGPPASAKTLFMLGCMKLERSYFTLGTNEINHMLTPLLSRFMVLHFKQYKFENFLDISIHMLGQEGIAKDIANEVATQVWHNMRSKDIRDCIKIAHLAKTKDDVIWIVETLLRYNKTSSTSEKKQ